MGVPGNIVRSLVFEKAYRLSRTRLMMRALRARNDGRFVPTLVQVQTVRACNGACVMCPQRSAKGDGALMQETVYEDIVRQVAAWPVVGVFVLTLQNEPLLDARLEAWVRHARHALTDGWELEITTNGSLLSPARAEALVAAGVDVINVSVNALTESTYNALMPGLGWADMRHNLDAILASSAGRRLMLRFVRMRGNQHERPPFMRMWRRRGIPVIAMACNDRLGSVVDYASLTPEGPRRWGAVKAALGRRLFRVCPFPYGQLNILADGELRACCHDYRGALRMGSALHGPLLETFNGSGYAALRRSNLTVGTRTGPCGRCGFYSGALWM